jgi:hypothetical protein
MGKTGFLNFNSDYTEGSYTLIDSTALHNIVLLTLGDLDGTPVGGFSDVS